MIHNPTERLAIVALIARSRARRLDRHGRSLHPAAVCGILLGMATMFATGLLVTV